MEGARLGAAVVYAIVTSFDRGGKEGDRGDQGQADVVDARNDIGGVGQGFAEHHDGTGGDHQGDQRKDRQAYRQAEKIADTHLPLALHETGEVAVIDYHRSEVGDHGANHRGKGRDGAAGITARAAEDTAQCTGQARPGLD